MRVGPADLVTSLRVVLAVPGFWASLSPSRFGWLVLVVFLAGVSDLLDGWVARRFGAGPTRFGAGLDPVCDGVFFGSVAVGLALGGTYPAWLAWVVVARYLLPVLAGGILLASGRLPRLRHTFFGQLSTAVIAVLLGAVALLRWGGVVGGPALVLVEVVVPVVTVLAWVDLARTARDLGSTGGARG